MGYGLVLQGWDWVSTEVVPSLSSSGIDQIVDAVLICIYERCRVSAALQDGDGDFRTGLLT